MTANLIMAHDSDHRESNANRRWYTSPISLNNSGGTVAPLLGIWGVPRLCLSGTTTTVPFVLLQPAITFVPVVKRVRVQKVYCHVFDFRDASSVVMTGTITLPRLDFTGVFPSYLTSNASSPLFTQSGIATIQDPTNPLMASAVAGFTVGLTPSVTPVVSTLNANVDTVTSQLLTIGASAAPAAVTITNTVPSFSAAFPTPIDIGSVVPVFQMSGFQIDMGVVRLLPVTAPALSLTPSGDASVVLSVAALSPNPSVVALTLYKTVYSATTGRWDIRNILLHDASYANYDYLDVVIDVYNRPQGLITGISSREWVLNLPFPVEIGEGEGLVCTMSVDTGSGDVTFVPFCRALIESIL